MTYNIALILLIASATTLAQQSSQKLTIEQVATELSYAYATRSLDKLDNKNYVAKKVKIIINHSIQIDKNETKEFKTLAEGERWLTSQEYVANRPVRAIKPLLGCQKNLCNYNFKDGISHEHLYLKKIEYSYKNGHPQIEVIYLLDGD
jgi:hypothetical protein